MTAQPESGPSVSSFLPNLQKKSRIEGRIFPLHKGRKRMGWSNKGEKELIFCSCP